jgi:hypothetical protein
MARRARVEYPGALYHVITRGNQGQRIFREDQDRDKYLVILASLKNHFSFRISAYARIESRLGIDKKIKKDIDEIVSSLENGKRLCRGSNLDY